MLIILRKFLIYTTRSISLITLAEMGSHGKPFLYMHICIRLLHCRRL